MEKGREGRRWHRSGNVDLEGKKRVEKQKAKTKQHESLKKERERQERGSGRAGGRGEGEGEWRTTQALYSTLGNARVRCQRGGEAERRVVSSASSITSYFHLSPSLSIPSSSSIHFFSPSPPLHFLPARPSSLSLPPKSVPLNSWTGES